MKKILFVMNTLGRAGAEMALLELLRGLSGKEYEVSLFVLTGQGEMFEHLPKHVKVLNKHYNSCSVHTAAGKRYLVAASLKALMKRANFIRMLPYLCYQTVSMLKKGKLMPDKLLWRVFSEAAPRFGEEYDLAIAYIEGGSTYYVADHVKARKKAAFFHVDYSMAGYNRSLDKDCYSKFHKIFPISGEVLSSFVKVYPEYEGKTEVFHNIINTGRILEMSKLPGGFSDSFDGKRILTVGRLTSQKDFAKSIMAAKLLVDRGRNIRWYIFGEGEEREALEQLIKELKLENVFFLPGVTENPYVYMRQADIYVHATGFEGKSIAIQEAQVLGCSILVSDCSGNREQVVHGVDGLLCELTPEGICEGVERFLEDEALKNTCAEAARKRQMTDTKELDKLLCLLEYDEKKGE